MGWSVPGAGVRVTRLEDLRPHTAVRGVVPDVAVTVVSVQWFGADALELTYKDPVGRVGQVLLYRDDEPRLEIVEAGRPWAFDGDGALFRLVSEAHRNALVLGWPEVARLARESRPEQRTLDLGAPRR